MNQDQLESIINAAWDDRANLSPQAASKEI